MNPWIQADFQKVQATLQTTVQITVQTIENEPQVWTASWKVPPHLGCLEGHFPGRPILPAVAAMEVSLLLLRAVTKTPGLELLEVSNAKFMAPIEPGMEFFLQASRKSGENRWRVLWKTAGEKSVADLILAVCDRRA